MVLLFRVFTDVFRDDDLSGWVKAGWALFVIVLPFLGVFIYFLARGDGMGKRQIQHARHQLDKVDAYVRQAVGEGGGSVDELAKLSELKAQGDISAEAFQRAKEKILR